MGWGGLWAAETLSEVLEPPGAPLRPAAPGCARWFAAWMDSEQT